MAGDFNQDLAAVKAGARPSGTPAGVAPTQPCLQAADEARIIESGPPAAILTNPAQERTRGFLRAILPRA